MFEITGRLALSRRSLLTAASGLAVSLTLPAAATVKTAPFNKGQMKMTTFTTKDGTEIFYKDWGSGQPIVCSHGWPLSADAWDAQMLFFAQNGYRVVAHDRRGHGRSAQPFEGNNMDRYADDLAELIEHLDLRNAVLIGHSTGGGEVAHYIGRHGNDRVAKVVLVGAVPPLMLKTADNPNGTRMEVFDNIRKGVAYDRSNFFRELTIPFFGFNRDGVETNQGFRDSFWLQGMAGSVHGQYECIHEFSEVDYTNDLKTIKVPTLVIHGDDDQIVPIDASAKLSAEIVADATLKIYPGGSHGLAQTEAETFNADVMDFIRS